MKPDAPMKRPKDIGDFDPAILKEYEKTSYQVKDPAGNLMEFTPLEWKRCPPKLFGIVTASNPGNQQKTVAENVRANEELESELRENGYIFYPTFDESNKRGEATFTIEGISRAEIMELGKKYGQYAVLHNEGEGPYFVRCAA